MSDRSKRLLSGIKRLSETGGFVARLAASRYKGRLRPSP